MYSQETLYIVLVELFRESNIYLNRCRNRNQNDVAYYFNEYEILIELMILYNYSIV